MTIAWRPLLSAALLFAVSTAASSQTLTGPARWADSARVQIESAHVAGDLARLMAARTMLDRALVAYPDDPWLLHYLGYALYRESILTENRDKRDVRALREQADSILQRSAARGAIPETHALRSSLAGQMIGSNPFRAMSLGSRADAEMRRAISLDRDNPRVLLMRGIGAMFTPEMFGGGLEKAERDLSAAIRMFANDKPLAPAPAWGKAEAYVWLGQLYGRQEKFDEARAAYQRALELEPDNRLVKDVLLPRLDRRRE